MLGVEAVVVVAEEASVEEDATGEGGEAAGEFGAAGGEAEEAIGVREIVEALSKAEDGNGGAVHRVGGPVVSGDDLREGLHFGDEGGDVVGGGRGLGGAAAEPGLGDSRIREEAERKMGEESDEEEDERA